MAHSDRNGLETDPDYEISIDMIQNELHTDHQGIEADPDYEISIDRIQSNLNQQSDTGLENTAFEITREPGEEHQGHAYVNTGHEAPLEHVVNTIASDPENRYITVLAEPEGNSHQPRGQLGETRVTDGAYSYADGLGTLKSPPIKNGNVERPPPPPEPMPISPEPTVAVNKSFVRYVSREAPGLPPRNQVKDRASSDGENKYDTLDEYESIDDIKRDISGSSGKSSIRLPLPLVPTNTSSIISLDRLGGSRRRLWLTVVILLVLCAVVVVVVVPSVVITRNKHGTSVIDECASSPCGSGNTCLNGVGSVTCYCVTGLTGDRCQTAILGPQIYFLETGALGSGVNGSISSLSPNGAQTRLTLSGGQDERGLAVDSNTNTIYYTTYNPTNSLWRASLSDISGTRTKIWLTPGYLRAVALASVDQLIFIEQPTSVIMIDYGLKLNKTIYVEKGGTWGLTVDQGVRIVYFTDETNSYIWKASFSPTGWVGSATVILSGSGTGEVGKNPEGIILEAGWLYWILYDTAEVRSMSTSGNSSLTVIPAVSPSVPSGVNSLGLGKRGLTFYYTSQTFGGVWAVTASGNSVKITPNTTLGTTGLALVQRTVADFNAIFFNEFNGNVTKLSPDGSLVRTPAGDIGGNELKIDVLNNYIFYTTCGAFALWRANVDNIDASRKRIWITNTSDCPYVMTLSGVDQLIFLYQASRGIVMVSYTGLELSTYSIPSSDTSVIGGLTVDTTNRILYFTDLKNGGKISRLSFTSSRKFMNTAEMILQGVSQVGISPNRILLDGDILYWLLDDGEIYSMSVNGTGSTLVVGAAPSSPCYHFTKKNQYFYHTIFDKTAGGVYRVVAGGARQKIANSSELPLGIDVY